MLLLVSRRWTRADKAFGLALVAGPLTTLASIALAYTCYSDSTGASSCPGAPPMLGPLSITVYLLIAFVVLWLYALIRLARRLR